MEGSCWVMIDIVQKGTSPSCGKQENDVEPNFDEVRQVNNYLSTVRQGNPEMVLELTPDLAFQSRLVIELSHTQHMADRLGSSPPPPRRSISCGMPVCARQGSWSLAAIAQVVGVRSHAGG